MLLFLLSGLLLLRLADRQFFALLFQLPPRFTRFEPFRPSSEARIFNKKTFSESLCVCVGDVRHHAVYGVNEKFLADPPPIPLPFSFFDLTPETRLQSVVQPDSPRKNPKPQEGNAPGNGGHHQNLLLDFKRQIVFNEALDISKGFSHRGSG